MKFLGITYAHMCINGNTDQDTEIYQAIYNIYKSLCWSIVFQKLFFIVDTFNQYIFWFKLTT